VSKGIKTDAFILHPKSVFTLCPAGRQNFIQKEPAPKNNAARKAELFWALLAQLFAQLLAQLDAEPLSLLNTQARGDTDTSTPTDTAMPPDSMFWNQTNDKTKKPKSKNFFNSPPLVPRSLGEVGWAGVAQSAGVSPFPSPGGYSAPVGKWLRSRRRGYAGSFVIVES